VHIEDDSTAEFADEFGAFSSPIRVTVTSQLQHLGLCGIFAHISHMSILREIQVEILDPKAKLGSILLKLRFLAARLESEALADWVKYETEGYPIGTPLPHYRYVGVSYKGTFYGPFNSGIQNAPIPPAVIDKYAGEGWTKHAVRQSIASVDELAESKHVGIDASNLILILQGKIYEDLACNSVTGSISPTAMLEISNAVRSRVLELTLEPEKKVPGAADVTLNQKMPENAETEEAVTKIFRQTVYGGVAR